MSATTVSPSTGDENKGPWLLALFWTEACLAILFVAVRFHTRYLMQGVGVDDWMMLIALILFVAAIACSTVLVYYGLGRHVATLPLDHVVEVAKWNWIVQPFGIMDLPFVKLSISFFLLRILGPNDRWQRWFLYINMVLFTTVFVLASIFSFVQCNPPRALWEDVPGAKCWDPAIQADWGTFGCAYSAFLDFALALLPTTILRGLNMSLKKKTSLGLLLSVGILSGVFGTIKTVQSQELAIREDATWGVVSLFAWGTSEVFLNIVCGCIPTLKPLYDKLVHKQHIRPSRKSYNYSGGSSSTEQIKSGNRKWLSRGSASEDSTNMSVSANMSASGLRESQIAVEHSYGYSYTNRAQEQV